MLGIYGLITRFSRKFVLSPVLNKAVGINAHFASSTSTPKAPPSKITAFTHFMKNTKKEDQETHADLRNKWGSLSDEEKKDYAIKAAKEDPRVVIPIVKLPRKMTIHKVFLKDLTAPNLSAEQIQKSWSALTSDEKRSLQKKADDFNTANAGNLEEPPMSSTKLLSGYKIFLMETSGSSNASPSTIPMLWKALTADERQVYNNRAQEICPTKKIVKEVDPNKPLSPGRFFVKKQVESGTSLEDARQKWKDMTAIDKAEFTIINMKETPHLIIAPKTIDKKLLAERIAALIPDDKDKL